MISYLVSFTFDVEAGSPAEAARIAEAFLMDPSAYPPIAEVTAPDGTSTDVDLVDAEG